MAERLAFEQLISELSAQFVEVGPEEVDDRVVQGLRQILDFFRLDRCLLLECAPRSSGLLRPRKS